MKYAYSSRELIITHFFLRLVFTRCPWRVGKVACVSKVQSALGALTMREILKNASDNGSKIRAKSHYAMLSQKSKSVGIRNTKPSQIVKIKEDLLANTLLLRQCAARTINTVTEEKPYTRH